MVVKSSLHNITDVFLCEKLYFWYLFSTMCSTFMTSWNVCNPSTNDNMTSHFYTTTNSQHTTFTTSWWIILIYKVLTSIPSFLLFFISSISFFFFYILTIVILEIIFFCFDYLFFGLLCFLFIRSYSFYLKRPTT